MNPAKLPPTQTKPSAFRFHQTLTLFSCWVLHFMHFLTSNSDPVLSGAPIHVHTTLITSLHPHYPNSWLFFFCLVYSLSFMYVFDILNIDLHTLYSIPVCMSWLLDQMPTPKHQTAASLPSHFSQQRLAQTYPEVWKFQLCLNTWTRVSR